MQLCSKGHAEIAHEGSQCPVCRLVNYYQGVVVDANREAVRLRRQVSELTALTENGDPEIAARIIALARAIRDAKAQQ